MRKLGLKLIVVALIGVGGRAFGVPDTQQRPTDMKSMTVAELEKAGDACRAEKDYEHAILYFQEAVRQDKKNAVLYNKLGLAELKNSDLQNARLHFERATKLNSKYADAFNNLGAVYFMQKNPGGAAKYFKKAVALDETRATFHVNLGAAWFNQKKFDKAVNEYARALELDPEALEKNARAGITAQIGSPEERAKFYYMLAKIHAKRGDSDNCILCLKKAKENGYKDMDKVYKEEEFARVWTDPRLQEVVPAPAPVTK